MQRQVSRPSQSKLFPKINTVVFLQPYHTIPSSISELMLKKIPCSAARNLYNRQYSSILRLSESPEVDASRRWTAGIAFALETDQ